MASGENLLEELKLQMAQCRKLDSLDFQHDIHYVQLVHLHGPRFDHGSANISILLTRIGAVQAAAQQHELLWLISFRATSHVWTLDSRKATSLRHHLAAESLRHVGITAGR